MLVVGIEVTDDGMYKVWYDNAGVPEMVECTKAELAVFLTDLHDVTPKNREPFRRTTADKLLALLPSAYRDVARDVLPVVGGKIAEVTAMRSRGMRGRRRLV